METTTSFDLNLAIQRWRENLGASPAFRHENLDELEAHLRDSIVTLQTPTLSTEEAFIIAARRLGKGGLLEMEFTKINLQDVWRDRVLWMLVGVQIWGLVASLTGSLARNALAWGWGSIIHHNYMKSGMALPIALFSLAQMLVIIASMVLCWWMVVRNGEKLGARLKPLLIRRSRLVAACAGLCLLLLASTAIEYVTTHLLFRSIGPVVYASVHLYNSCAQLILLPIQGVSMFIITLALARKSLRACPA